MISQHRNNDYANVAPSCAVFHESEVLTSILTGTPARRRTIRSIPSTVTCCFFSVAFWLSRTLCFFKEVKASLRMLWERKMRLTSHAWQEFQLAHYDYHHLCYYLCSETVRQHHCTNRCTTERFIRLEDRLDVLPRHCRLLFPLSPEIKEIFSFVDELNCDRCV